MAARAAIDADDRVLVESRSRNIGRRQYLLVQQCLTDGLSGPGHRLGTVVVGHCDRSAIGALVRVSELRKERWTNSLR